MSPAKASRHQSFHATCPLFVASSRDSRLSLYPSICDSLRMNTTPEMQLASGRLETWSRLGLSDCTSEKRCTRNLSSSVRHCQVGTAEQVVLCFYHWQPGCWASNSHPMEASLLQL
jgi:hypothetical protein